MSFSLHVHFFHRQGHVGAKHISPMPKFLSIITTPIKPPLRFLIHFTSLYPHLTMVLALAAPNGWYCSNAHINLGIKDYRLRARMRFGVFCESLPSFLPKEVEKIKDPFAIKLARRIERVPVQVTFSDTPIMSSCVRPLRHGQSTDPIVLLHGFDGSCLEWRFVMPLLEEAGLESWAVDILGWGFSDLEGRPSCNVASKRSHLYQLWKSYVKRPMILIGPSLGAAVAIDFSVNYPEAVSKLILIDASVYAEGTENMAKLPRIVAYAGAALLKSMPLRLYVNTLGLKGISFGTNLDCMNIGRLHCHFPWWEDATVDFMRSGGYNVISLIKQVSQKTLVIWGEEDKIISYKFAMWLHCEMQDAKLRQIPDCGHIPHIEKPKAVADLIVKFARTSSC